MQIKKRTKLILGILSALLIFGGTAYTAHSFWNTKNGDELSAVLDEIETILVGKDNNLIKKDNIIGKQARDIAERDLTIAESKTTIEELKSTIKNGDNATDVFVEEILPDVKLEGLGLSEKLTLVQAHVNQLKADHDYLQTYADKVGTYLGYMELTLGLPNGTGQDEDERLDKVIAAVMAIKDEVTGIIAELHLRQDEDVNYLQAGKFETFFADIKAALTKDREDKVDLTAELAKGQAQVKSLLDKAEEIRDAYKDYPAKTGDPTAE